MSLMPKPGCHCSDPSAPSVVCAGRVYCDLIFTGVPQMPVLGQEVFADELALHAGGGAFITAATFAALGLKTSVAATLPAPPLMGWFATL